MEGNNTIQTAPAASEEEIKWVAMLSEGKSYKEISVEYKMPKNTVAYKLTSLRDRFNCENSTQLACLFLRNKLID